MDQDEEQDEPASIPVRRVETAARALADLLDAFQTGEPPMRDGRPDLALIGELVEALEGAWTDYSAQARFFDL